MRVRGATLWRRTCLPEQVNLLCPLCALIDGRPWTRDGNAFGAYRGGERRLDRHSETAERAFSFVKAAVFFRKLDAVGTHHSPRSRVASGNLGQNMAQVVDHPDFSQCLRCCQQTSPILAAGVSVGTHECTQTATRRGAAVVPCSVLLCTL